MTGQIKENTLGRRYHPRHRNTAAYQSQTLRQFYYKCPRIQLQHIATTQHRASLPSPMQGSLGQILALTFMFLYYHHYCFNLLHNGTRLPRPKDESTLIHVNFNYFLKKMLRRLASNLLIF